MVLTKRETITLIILTAFLFTLAALIQFASFKMTEGWQYLLTVIIFFTLGPYIVLDPERINKEGK
jgi:predicted Na+-dependent transporter